MKTSTKYEFVLKQDFTNEALRQVGAKVIADKTLRQNWFLTENQYRKFLSQGFLEVVQGYVKNDHCEEMNVQIPINLFEITKIIKTVNIVEERVQ